MEMVLSRARRGRVIVMATRDIVVRLVPVIAHAVAVFGDEQKAIHWFYSPLETLNGQTPPDLLANDQGIGLVDRTLSRIEHNIPS